MLTEPIGRIYIIVNKHNGKMYIGLTTKSIEVRLSGHIHDSKYRDAPINRAIRKYGKDAFEIFEIETCCTIDELNEREKFFIKYFNTFDSEHYNATSGGYNFKLSKETCDKISKSHIVLRDTDPEWLRYRQGENNGMYGKGYLIAGDKNGMYGKKHSEEVC